MYIVPGTTFDLITRLTLDSQQVAAFLGGFLPLLPSGLDDNYRQLLKDGMGKLLTIGVKQPLARIDYAPLLTVLERIDPESLKVRYATQKQVPLQIKNDMATISRRWDTLRRRTRAANALLMYQRKERITAAKLSKRLEIQSPGYLTYLMTLRRSVSSLDIAGRIESLIGLPVGEFLVPSKGGYKHSRPTKDEFSELFGRPKVRKLLKELQPLTDSDLDTVRSVIRSLSEKKQ